MLKFAPNFCYCAVGQEKAVFQWKRAVSCPSALLVPEMLKFAPNFCYCVVDQEKAVFFNGNGPFLAHLPFGPPEMVKFASHFCHCAVDQEALFLMETSRFWPIRP